MLNFFIKEQFKSEIYEKWKKVHGNNKHTLEKLINSYEVRDFFHINTDYNDEFIDEQIYALANVLKYYWTLSIKERYPTRNFVIRIVEDESGDEPLIIQFYEE